MAMDMKVSGHAATAMHRGKDGAAQAGKMGEAGDAAQGQPPFLSKFHKLPDSRLETKSSGLKIGELSSGQGPAAAKGMTLIVRYTGWTEDGKKFDSSEDKGAPFEFALGSGNVIKGWDEGLAGAKPGERLQLVIPAGLAYGNRQVGEIPPNATLVFNVEVLAVNPATTSANPKGNLSVTA